MKTRDWRRLEHIREQQERLARLKLATAAGQLRDATAVHASIREQTDAANDVWRQMLTAPVLGSHWLATACSNAAQQQLLIDAEKQVQQAKSAMELVGQEHRETVVDKEMAQTLVERQLAEERREAWQRLQLLIDEHTSASRNYDSGLEVSVGQTPTRALQG